MNFCALFVSFLVISYCETNGFKVSKMHNKCSVIKRGGETFCSEKAIEETAREVARLAGALMLKGVGKSAVETKSSSKDIVTKVDKAAQCLIVDGLKKAFPDHHILAEEDFPTGISAAQEAIKFLQDEEHLWIIDPIDGTTNFASGIPLAGVIIAYASRGETQFGLILDPYRDETFTAWKGKGAFMNGQRIHCSSISTLVDSVVCTGSPPNTAALDACLRATHRLSPHVRSVRMLGSAAIMLAWVAAGRASAYFEADLNVWDLAAGALLVREAGGLVSTALGAPYTLSTRNLVASNGLVHEALLHELDIARMWIE